MSDIDDDDDAPDRSRIRVLTGILAVVLAGVVMVWWPGCREYPPVTSREALSHMKLLYSACNTRDTARLERCEKALRKLEQAGKLSEEEREAFDRILAMAKSGAWAEAEAASFKFAQDQVGQGGR